MFPRVYCEKSGHIIISTGREMVNVAVTCHFSINHPSAFCVWLKLDFLACESALEEEAGGVDHFPTCEAGSAAHHGKLDLLSTQQLGVHLLLAAHVVFSCRLAAFIVVKLVIRWTDPLKWEEVLKEKKEVSCGVFNKDCSFTFRVGQLPF